MSSNRSITVLDDRITIKERIPPILMLVLLLNVYSLTAVFALVLAVLFIFINMKHVVAIKTSDYNLLTMLAFPIMLLMMIGTASGVIHNYLLYEVFKDTYFFIKVIIFIIFSFIVFKKYRARQISNAFIYTGIISCIIYVILMVIYYLTGHLDFSTLYRYRKSLPDISYDPMISIILLLFTAHAGNTVLKYSKLFVIFQLLVILTTLSRFSMLILLTIFLFFLKLKLGSRTFYQYASYFLIIIIAFFAFKGGITVTESQNVSSQLMIRIANTFDELFTGEFETKKDIITNWRAYESVMGIRKYLFGDRISYFIGHGFGAVTDIGFKIKLGGVEWSDIPTFHNGYIYLLVKLGIVGILVYFYFISRIIIIVSRNDKKIPFRDPEILNLRSILYLLILFLIFVTWVFFGIFNKAVFNNIVILTTIMIFQYQHHVNLLRKNHVST